MAMDICRRHGQVDTPEHPCIVCVIESIDEHARSRDGSPETDELQLKTIQEICKKTLKLLDPGHYDEEEEDAEEERVHEV